MKDENVLDCIKRGDYGDTYQISQDISGRERVSACYYPIHFVAELYSQEGRGGIKQVSEGGDQDINALVDTYVEPKGLFNSIKQVAQEAEHFTLSFPGIMVGEQDVVLVFDEGDLAEVSFDMVGVIKNNIMKDMEVLGALYSLNKKIGIEPFLEDDYMDGYGRFESFLDDQVSEMQQLLNARSNDQDHGF